MPGVTGIGGVFFRAKDPDALRRWYEEHLGIARLDWGGHVFEARAGDQTVWSIGTLESEYWPTTQGVMINYRVDDLDAVLARLRSAGAEVDEKVDEQEYGRFGWAADPEGNRFELWQPPTS